MRPLQGYVSWDRDVYNNSGRCALFEASRAIADNLFARARRTDEDVGFGQMRAEARKINGLASEL